MKFKTIFLIALTGALLTGIYQLQNIFSTPDNPEVPKSGAAQYEGKVDVPDSPYFAKLDVYNMQPTATRIILPRFKTYQQTTNYTCGPAAALMVTQHFAGAPLHSEMEIGRIMGVSKFNGINTKGMVKYFKEIGWNVASSADTTSPENYRQFLSFVSSNLKENKPIIVENVDWGGHWRVIIGYDNMGTEYAGDDVLLMADPYDLADHCQDGYVIVPAQKFFYMWFDAQLYSANERKRQWLVAYPAQ